LSFGSTAEASSHREAPFITKNPKVDGTDFYMFDSYETGRTGYVTFLANYQPLQVPSGGPNFYKLDDQALYEISIDNVGDGNEHVTFQFQFSDPLNTSGNFLAFPIGGDAGATVDIPFLNASPFTGFSGSGPAWNATTNRNVSYKVTQVTGNRRTGTATAISAASGGATSFSVPVDYVGNTTFGNAAAYETYAQQFVQEVSIPGCTPPSGTNPRVWVGQRAEGFAVNLGVTFDLLDTPNIAAVLTGGSNAGSDCNTGNGSTTPPVNTACPNNNPIGGYNVTTIALEVPISCVKGASDTIGAWTTASVPQARVINPTGSYAVPAKEGGAWAQVSRLGMPLVNELVIGLKDKDLWNSSAPVNDASNFADYVLYPTLPAVIEALYGAAAAPTLFPRADLIAAFLTGVPGVNEILASDADASAVVKSEMLRLNTTLGAPVAKGSQNSLGALYCFTPGGLGALTNGNGTGDAGAGSSCDPAGFPNGRRPGDDVVDITLRVAEGYLLPAADAPAGGVPFTDDIEVDSSKFQAVFPYLNTPNSGNPG
jgi:hypothetical protein